MFLMSITLRHATVARQPATVQLAEQQERWRVVFSCGVPLADQPKGG